MANAVHAATTPISGTKNTTPCITTVARSNVEPVRLRPRWTRSVSFRGVDQFQRCHEISRASDLPWRVSVISEARGPPRSAPQQPGRLPVVDDLGRRL